MNIIVGISGASGVIMAKFLLEALSKTEGVTVHLIMTSGATVTMTAEHAGTPETFKQFAAYTYDNHDFTAPIASGSFPVAGMVIVPCSMKTVAGIVTGYSDNLLLRAADVTVKEARPLIIVPRELPFSAIHLKNLSQAAAYGVTVMPPVMTFYNGAATVDEHIHHLIGKIMAKLGLRYEHFRPWQGV